MTRVMHINKKASQIRAVSSTWPHRFRTKNVLCILFMTLQIMTNFGTIKELLRKCKSSSKVVLMKQIPSNTLYILCLMTFLDGFLKSSYSGDLKLVCNLTWIAFFSIVNSLYVFTAKSHFPWKVQTTPIALCRMKKIAASSRMEVQQRSVKKMLLQ